jgi:hypothetical protein
VAGLALVALHLDGEAGHALPVLEAWDRVTEAEGADVRRLKVRERRASSTYRS